MRTFLILVCSIALACSASAQNDNKSKKQTQKGKQAQSAQYARPVAAPKKTAPKRYQPGSNATSYQKAKGRQGVNNQVYQSRPNVTPTKKSSQQIAGQRAQAGRYQTSAAAYKKAKQGQQGVNRQAYQSTSNLKKTNKASQQVAVQNAQAARYSKKTGQRKVNKASAAAFQSNGRKYKAQRFNLESNTRPTKYASVNFQQNRRIHGSQYWQGKNYWAFRNYRPVWHDRGWWRSHYNRVVFVYGGWYYWNAGWWYPAWGYAPSAYYAWDGPIYAYNGLPPDQVVANVQAALQAQGYYQGDVDGLLGPLTRQAIADYQRDNGLYMTSAIDEPTLASLGMT
jgi:hypothetical protein